MSRAPAVRFPPPVLSSAPLSSSTFSSSSYSNRSAPVLYDSDEDAAPFQLIPSPEHLRPPTATSDSATRSSSSSSRTSTSAHRPIQHLYEEEEDLVSPSSSYTMSPSASLDQLSAVSSSRDEQRPSYAESTADRGRSGAAGGAAGPSRRGSARQRQVAAAAAHAQAALRLDLLDADEEESLAEGGDGGFDEEAEAQPTADRRLLFSSTADARQGQSGSAGGGDQAGAKRPSASALSTAVQSAAQRSSSSSSATFSSSSSSLSSSSSSFSSALPSTSSSSSSAAQSSQLTALLHLDGGSFQSSRPASASAPRTSSPLRIAQTSMTPPALASSPLSSLPSTSFDDFGHQLRDSSLRDGAHERLTRSSRGDDEEEDDDGDVIELEDDERDRDSSGGSTSAPRSSTILSTPTLAPTSTSRTPPRTPPMAVNSASASLSSTSMHSSSSSSVSFSTSAVRVPRIASSSTVSLLTAAASDGDGADDDDEDGHNDQQREERDDLASSIIELSSHPQDQLTIRAFTSPASIHSHISNAASLLSPSSSSSATSHPSRHPRTPPPDLSSDIPIPFSPPTSGGDDDYNDGNVMIVRRTTSPSDPQHTHRGTDDEEEADTDAPFTVEDEPTERLLPPSRRPSATAAALSASSPSPSVKSSSRVDDDDGLAEAKQRREKLHEKTARRLQKKAQRESERLKREQQERAAEVEDDNIIEQSERDRKRQQRSSSGDDDEEQTHANNQASDDSSTSDDDDDDDEDEEDNDDAVEGGYGTSARRPSGSRGLLGLSGSHAGQPAHSSPPSVHKPSVLFSSSASASSGGASPSLSLSRHYSPSPPSRDELSRREARHERRSSRQLIDRSHLEPERDGDSPGTRDNSSPLTPARHRTHSRGAGTDTARGESKERDRETLGVGPPSSHRVGSGSRKKKRGSVDEIQYSDLVFENKIGEGAYGDVYRGYLWGQEVAIKKIRLEKGDDEAARVREFRKEMKIMRQLRHPNVVEYLGSCVTGHSLCLLTEFLQSGSLEDQLLRLRREGKRMRVQRVVGLAMDVAKGLNWLHHKGIIHRDLKSANILITEAGRAKISDFGLSHVRRRSEESMVGYHGVAGSPSYIAPEVLQQKEYGVAADVYSFGILLNEMVSGAVPYDDTPLAQLELNEFERRVIDGQRPLLAQSDCQPLLELVEECWRAVPTQRPSVEGLMKRLERIDKTLTAAASAAPLLDAATTSSTSSSSSSSSVTTALSALDDLPLPLRTLLASDYARLFSLQQALAEQERQLRATSAAMQSEKVAREAEQRQWEEKKASSRREEQHTLQHIAVGGDQTAAAGATASSNDSG